MKIKMLFRLAWGALAARKLRAILTIMGIVIGPALIVGLVGATQGFQASAEERFNNMGLNTLFVSRNLLFTWKSHIKLNGQCTSNLDDYRGCLIVHRPICVHIWLRHIGLPELTHTWRRKPSLPESWDYLRNAIFIWCPVGCHRWRCSNRNIHPLVL